MKKLIDITSESVVVCDNKDCDYTVPYKRKYLILFLNIPCPKCGQNLLTEHDFLVHERMMRLMDFVNRWFSWLTIFMGKNTTRKTISVHYHDGVTTTEEVKTK